MGRGEALQPRTMLEAIKIDRGAGWRGVARLVAEATQRRFSERSIERVGTAYRPPGRNLAQALESTFALPIDILIGPYVQGTPIPDPDSINPQEVLSMAAKKTRDVGINLPDLNSYSYLEAELRDLARAYPVTPLPELINPLATVQASILESVTKPSGHSDGRRLYALAAISCGLMAKACHDYGQPRDAVTQIRTALMFADQIGHQELKGWLHGLMSLVWYWDAAPRGAVDSAVRGLGEGATGTTALWLHASAARGHARMGNVEETLASVRSAEDVAEAIEPGELDDIGGLLTFSRARAQYYYADAVAWLPRHPDGERIAEQAVAAYANPDSDGWAFGDAAGASCALAITRLHKGDLEGARSAITAVLILPRERRIGGIIKSVKRVDAALIGMPATGACDDLRDELEAFIRAPMVLSP